MQYLVSKFGGRHSYLYPKDLQKRAIVDRLLYYDLGSVYKTVTEYMVINKSLDALHRVCIADLDFCLL